MARVNIDGIKLVIISIDAKSICFHWTNGDSYIGDWRDGVPHGHGEFTYGTEGDKMYFFIKYRNYDCLH